MTTGAPTRRPERPGLGGWCLIGIGILVTILFLVLPLVLIFKQAFGSGLSVFWANITTRDTVRALELTLLVVALVLPVNFAIGLSGAWLVAYHRFRGRELFLAISKVPISLSPIVAGICYMMLFGQRGWFGPWLEAHHIRIMFAFPAIFLATLFVSFPYLLNQLVPVMEELGHDEEIVADQLGASGWKLFWQVTFPKIRWSVVYGLILANARALGEFGAVSVVSGHIRGETNTLALQVEVLYQDYNGVAAFGAAALLAALALATLGGKTLVERIRAHRSRDSRESIPTGVTETVVGE
jgi:sulfate transport system permease protein